ncbi:MAG: acetate--CoA ligase [Thermaerobacter sp.]|nr:MAG: acetate--CoA ligase [Bacillota bacterium]
MTVAQAREPEPVVDERSIEVHWREEDTYQPRPEFIAQANLTDPDFYRRFSLDNFPDCYDEYARLLDWDKYWHTTLDASNPPFYKWFVGGRLNASYNCVDRHRVKDPNKTAIHFVPEPEDEPILHVTYQDLWIRVNEFAALLREFAGVKPGDRVTIHMPMVAELPVAMLACARLGAMHSVVFGGFSAKACADRMVDAGSNILITMDAYWRNGQLLDHKAKADDTVKEAAAHGLTVDKVLIWQRYPGRYSSQVPLVEGRDFIVNDLLPRYRGARVEPVSMPAEAPLFLMYTSGSTGKPKAVQHSTGGYLAYVTATARYYLDIKPEDVYWCMADIGWITGHSYIVYGPLSNGTSTVVYEGVPTYPDPGRPWRIAEELGVTIFHTSPTAIRQLRKAGPDVPRRYNHKFKLMVTVGEPIEPDVWRWYYHEVGKGQAVIVDTWWQTETGGFLCTQAPALMKMKPGSAGPGVLGINPVVFDEDGREIEPGSGQAGYLCIRNPWPGMMQTIWGDPDRFIKTYFAKFNKNPNSKDWRDWPYMAGDGAVIAEDGYVRILGRLDDVINVAGHRLGTKEIENAALQVPEVAEAAVVAAHDEIKGTVPDLYVALNPGVEPSDDIKKRVSDMVSEVIGKIARPRAVHIVPDLPKTRSGKIMRRILAAISDGREDVGDVTTLANPEVVEAIRQQVQGG